MELSQPFPHLGFYQTSYFFELTCFFFPKLRGFLSFFPLSLVLTSMNWVAPYKPQVEHTRPRRVLFIFPLAWVFYFSHGKRLSHLSSNRVLAATLFPELEVFHLSSKGFLAITLFPTVGFGPGGLFPTWGFLNFPQASPVGFSQLSPLFSEHINIKFYGYQARRLLRSRNGRSSSTSRGYPRHHQQHTVHFSSI